MYTNPTIQSADNREYWNGLIDTLAENDYLYIFDTSENVSIALSDYSLGNEFYDHSLYIVQKEENDFYLEQVQYVWD